MRIEPPGGRLFMLRLISQCISIILMVVTHLSVVFAGEAVQRPPNIILIMADDLGYGELGCYGQTKIKTPHIDRLAQMGMRFTRAYSGNAVCAPSRCVLLTGQHPGHAYVRDNRELKPEGQEPLPAQTLTLGSLLQQQGYVTGAFGKWGLGGPGSSGDPMVQGFNRFFGYNCQRVSHSFYPPYLWSDREKFPLQNNPPIPGHGTLSESADPAKPASYAAFKGSDYAPYRIHSAAMDFIDQHKERPFFLYYPTLIPHLALQVPDDKLETYLALGWNDPPFIGKKGAYTPHRTPRAAYAAMISLMDAHVGAIMDRLKMHGLTDNTLIIFTSDNGATHLLDQVDVPFFNSVDGLRGLKGELYEGGIRVPYIAAWPGKITAGSVSDRIIGFEDMLPTVAELSRAVFPPCDGISLLPTFLGQPQPERSFLYREFSGYGSQQAVWFGPWKAIRSAMRKGVITTQLYRVADDRTESTDVATAFPDIVKQAEALFTQQHVPSPAFPLVGIDTP